MNISGKCTPSISKTEGLIFFYDCGFRFVDKEEYTYMMFHDDVLVGSETFILKLGVKDFDKYFYVV